MALAHQFNYLNVQIGTVDFTSYLANVEQIASVPAGSEIGRATLVFLDTGSLPAIPRWGTVVIKAGTAAPGTVVWGGYATRQNSEPKSISGGDARQVTVDCQSYAIALLTNAPISETYGGGNKDSILTDTVIVADLALNYLPAFYDAASISSDSPIQCDYIQFSNETMRSCLNKIGERGYKDYGISADAKFYYRPSAGLGTLAHQLDEFPDISDSFFMKVAPYYDQDDVEVRNAVRVVGGWTLSAVQDETFVTDGIAYEFQVDYYPQEIIRVALANIVQSVGVYLVDDPADFDCLVWYDQRKFIYQLPPVGGKTLEILYRYPVRVEQNVFDATSIAAIGGTLWAQTIEDSSISDSTVAQLVGSAYLARATASVDRAQISTTYVGTATPYLPGQIIQVSVQSFGWDKSELEIQAVTMRFASRPGGTGQCLTYWDLDVGTPLSVGRTLGDAYNDAPEIKSKPYSPNISVKITAEDLPAIDHGSGLTGQGDDDHTQYLLATGTRTGASLQAQTFTNGIIGPTWRPASDSTTAIQIQKAGGTPVITIDTTNGRIGIGCTPTAPFDLVGSAQSVPFAYYLNKNDDANWAPIRYGWALANGSNEFGINIGAYNAGGNAILRWQMYGSPTQWQFDPGSDDIFSIEKRFLAKAGLMGSYHTDLDIVLNQHTNGGADKGIKFKVAGGSTTAAVIMETGLFGVGTDAPTSLVHASLNNAMTNAVDNILTIAHNSTGTPTAGFGSGLAFNLESSTTPDQAAAAIAVSWYDATHASRTSRMVFTTVYNAASVPALSLNSAGAVFNDDGNGWADFRVEGDTSSSLLFVDASADNVGIGEGAPATRLHVQVTDSGTNTSTNSFTLAHNSAGTPAAGFGVGTLFKLKSDTTADQNAALIEALWGTATHASRKGQLALSAYDASAARRGLTIGSDGAAAVVGLYSAAPVAQATTGGAAATFTANSGTAVNDASTFDGYTIKQAIKALRNLGVLA